MDIITQIHRAVHAIGMRVSDELEITQPEALVLYYLAPKGAAPLEDVHRAFLHKRSTLTSVLERLEGRGLVERVPTPHDRRRFDIRLTKSGKRVAQRVAALFNQIADEGGGTQHERKAAAQLLGRIARVQEAAD